MRRLAHRIFPHRVVGPPLAFELEKMVFTALGLGGVESPLFLKPLLVGVECSSSFFFGDSELLQLSGQHVDRSISSTINLIDSQFVRLTLSIALLL